MRTVIIGGGAAGFFLAINLKEMMPEMEVTIFERSQRVLSKVEVSGGGRCNCTNSFEAVTDLQMVYPRGHRLMKRLFNVFDHREAYAWFERHGVPLVTQDDECVFPAVQDSHAIINCFLSLAHRYHVNVCLGQKVQSLDVLSEYDYIAVTTGGSPKGEGLRWLRDMGHEIAEPVPSLFTFQINDKSLTSLMGTVAEEASVMIPATKFRAEGPLLITHWGMSGPAILKLSSYAARQLADQHYQMPLSVNWLGKKLADVESVLSEAVIRYSPKQLSTVNWLGKKLADVESVLSEAVIRYSPKQLSTVNPFGLPQRLWSYLLAKSLAARMQIRWGELNKKDANRLVNVLCNDTYEIAGRAAFKDEFVTCGGVSLKSVNPSTLESKMVPNLFFAGEVLDIDGITGGFNFQAAWTTAYTVATSIVGKLS